MPLASPLEARQGLAWESTHALCPGGKVSLEASPLKPDWLHKQKPKASLRAYDVHSDSLSKSQKGTEATQCRKGPLLASIWITMPGHSLHLPGKSLSRDPLGSQVERRKVWKQSQELLCISLPASYSPTEGSLLHVWSSCPREQSASPYRSRGKTLPWRVF